MGEMPTQYGADQPDPYPYEPPSNFEPTPYPYERPSQFEEYQRTTRNYAEELETLDVYQVG